MLRTSCLDLRMVAHPLSADAPQSWKQPLRMRAAINRPPPHVVEACVGCLCASDGADLDDDDVANYVWRLASNTFRNAVEIDFQFNFDSALWLEHMARTPGGCLLQRMLNARCDIARSVMSVVCIRCNTCSALLLTVTRYLELRSRSTSQQQE